MKTKINTGIVRVCKRCGSDLFTIVTRVNLTGTVKIFECMDCGHDEMLSKNVDSTDHVADALRYTVQVDDFIYSDEKIKEWASKFDRYSKTYQQGRQHGKPRDSHRKYFL